MSAKNLVLGTLLMSAVVGCKVANQSSETLATSVLTNCDNFNDMKSFFACRLERHRGLVAKYADLIGARNFPGVSSGTLASEMISHDKDKYQEPEYTPYLHIVWKAKMKSTSTPYTPPADMLPRIQQATFDHVRLNRHHPEFWDKTVTIDCINPNDRDKPPEKMVNGVSMEPTYVAEMVADWLGMSDEFQTDIEQWKTDNIWKFDHTPTNKRWMFTDDQIGLINSITDVIKSDKRPQ